MNPKEKMALKALANDLELPYEHINPKALLHEVNGLPHAQNLVIQIRYGLFEDSRDIAGCASRLQISIVQANKLLYTALQMLQKKKNSFYQPDKTFTADYETEISELGDINVRSYNCLIRAGKQYISDIENMSLSELLDIPGLKPQDYKNILLALEEYRKKYKPF